MRTLLRAFASRRLTIVCFAATIVLAILGILAQSPIGLTGDSQSLFYSYVVTWIAPWAEIAIPLFPGGYSIGLVLAANLLISLFTRFRFEGRRVSLSLVYLGIIAFIFAEFVGSYGRRFSSADLLVGETTLYSESDKRVEIALVNESASERFNRVLAIPQEILSRERELRAETLPFVVSIDRFLPESEIVDRTPELALTGPIVSQGIGKRRTAVPTRDDAKTRFSSAFVTLYSDTEVIGTWLVSEAFGPQRFVYDKTTYTLSLRPERYYHPFRLTMVDFSAARHTGAKLMKSLSAVLEISPLDDGTSRIETIAAGQAVEADDLTILIDRQEMPSERLTVTFSRQRAKGLYIAASWLVGVGLLARLIGFGLAWLRENAEAAP